MASRSPFYDLLMLLYNFSNTGQLPIFFRPPKRPDSNIKVPNIDHKPRGVSA